MVMELGNIPERVIPLNVGEFIHQFLISHEEAYPSEIHRQYKMERKVTKTLKNTKYRSSTYHSFMVYVSKLILTGLIERTGRTEESTNQISAALEYPERVYVRLSLKGRNAPDYVWVHPLRLWYNPFDWERATFRDYIKPG